MSIRVIRLGTARLPGEGTRIGTVRRPPRGVPKKDFSRRNWYDVWFPSVAPSLAPSRLSPSSSKVSAAARKSAWNTSCGAR